MAQPTLQQIIAALTAQVGPDSGLGGTILFDFGEEGSVLIDGKSIPNTVSDGNGKTGEATVRMSVATFAKLVKGEMDATAAFYAKQLTVDGNTSLLSMLAPVLVKGRSS